VSKLVNVGSLCIDFVYSVPSLVKAGETVASAQRQVFAGGKGLNQSLAAARAGAHVEHYGAVGDDGDLLLAVLAAEGIDDNGVLRLDGPSGHAVIQVDRQGQNAIVISGGCNRRLSDELFHKAVASMQEGDWLLLQNEINDVDRVMHLAADQGAKIAFNVAPPDERIFGYPLELLALLIVNEPEAMALAKCDSPEAAFAELITAYPQTSLLLTQGKDGLMFYDAQTGQRARMAAFAVQPVDETAAGDAFVGYLMAGLVTGLELTETLAQASAAGALAVTQEGAAPSIPAASAVAALMNAQTVPKLVTQT
jgi:ribokinase